MKDIEEDFDNIVSGSIYFDDLDEIDYFDSEDEYWEKSKNKKIEDNLLVCVYCFLYYFL